MKTKKEEYILEAERNVWVGWGEGGLGADRRSKAVERQKVCRCNNNKKR